MLNPPFLFVKSPFFDESHRFLPKTAQVDTLLQAAPDRSALLGMLGALEVRYFCGIEDPHSL